MNLVAGTSPEYQATSTLAPDPSPGNSMSTAGSTSSSISSITVEDEQSNVCVSSEVESEMPAKTHASQQPKAQPQMEPIFLQWTQFTSSFHNGISKAVVAVSRQSAQNPRRVISVTTFLALVLPLIGLFTNFKIEVEQEAILAPFDSLSRQHHEWIEADSTGFPESTRPFDLLIHQDGDNVITISTMKRVFEALNVFTTTPGYKEICAFSDYEMLDGQPTCHIHAATRFWWHNEDLFELEVQTDEDMIAVLSQDEYPPDTPVGDHDFILGNYEMIDVPGGENGTTVATIVSAQSYILRIDVPIVPEATSRFEDLVVEHLLELREKWLNDETVSARLEFHTFRSIPNEFERAMLLDLPLYPAVFFIMCGFACITFFRKDPVHSRCLLGIGAVLTIGLSLLAGCGLMFIIGIPLSNLTGSLAFVVFGVGLDDTFIIMGQYNRTNPRKDVVERVCETLEVVGLSIFVTTLTTMMAFVLGSTSAVPAIRWLCIYAAPTILINFLLQISFFISLLVLDEHRIQEDKRDCCFCYTVPQDQRERGYSRESTKDMYLSSDESCSSTESFDGVSEGKKSPGKEGQQVDAVPRETTLPKLKARSDLWSDDITLPPKTYQEKFMMHYANFLMRPCVKAGVIVCFLAYLALAMWSATLLQQEFRAEEIVPQDSYVKGFLDGVNQYSVQVIQVGSYFRNVDQSDPVMQQHMRDYIYELAELEQIGESPPFCWVQDFAKYIDENEELTELVGDLTFDQKLNLAFSIPAMRELYGSDIVRDENTGNVTASRCWFFVKNLDMQDVGQQIDMLLDQRAVSSNNAVNEGRPEFAFFSFSIWYIIWEFYTVAMDELILTTISGIVAVSIVAFLFIPHWTAVLFVTPLITALYIDLLGTLQFAGVSVNVVTYVCLVISVGLLVDFLMHVLLRYYESHGQTREEKVRDTLETMGPSILVGGLSTFLGVVPLAFSTNEVAKVVFTSFIAMVSLGLCHGLIFLPVVLSLVGPSNTTHRTKVVKKSAKDEKLEKPSCESAERLIAENAITAGGDFSNTIAIVMALGLLCAPAMMRVVEDLSSFASDSGEDEESEIANEDEDLDEELQNPSAEPPVGPSSEKVFTRCMPGMKAAKDLPCFASDSKGIESEIDKDEVEEEEDLEEYLQKVKGDSSGILIPENISPTNPNDAESVIEKQEEPEEELEEKPTTKDVESVIENETEKQGEPEPEEQAEKTVGESSVRPNVVQSFPMHAPKMGVSNDDSEHKESKIEPDEEKEEEHKKSVGKDVELVVEKEENEKLDKELEKPIGELRVENAFPISGPVLRVVEDLPSFASDSEDLESDGEECLIEGAKAEIECAPACRNPPKLTWKSLTDDQGRTYYYHCETRKTQWAKPPEFDWEVAAIKKYKETLSQKEGSEIPQPVDGNRNVEMIQAQPPKNTPQEFDPMVQQTEEKRKTKEIVLEGKNHVEV